MSNMKLSSAGPQSPDKSTLQSADSRSAASSPLITAPLTTRHLLLIGNPTAGAGAGRINRVRLLDSAVRHLENHGLHVRLELETSSAAVSERAAWGVREGYRRIVAAGGDGTVNAVVNGLMHAYEEDPTCLEEVALGVLPIGTGNVFAFNLGIARSWRQACRVLRQGHTRRIDVGLAQGVGVPPDGPGTGSQPRYFLLMAGIGFDAKVVEDTGLRLKFFLRDFAYVLKTLQNVVLHQGAQMTLRLDDNREHSQLAWMVMIGNAASYAWDIKVTSHAQLDDGLLDVCLMPFHNKIISIQQALQILMGQHVERGIARYWQVQRVCVESDPPVPVQLDGDEWGYTPVQLSLNCGVLNVLAPPEPE